MIAIEKDVAAFMSNYIFFYAFDDIDGERYNREDICPNINYECNGYLTDGVDGISGWYVPTAGQWKRIIENLSLHIL